MKRLLQATALRRDGFTIVELLVVIVVIAILAAITIVSFTGIRTRAAEAALSTELVSNAKSLEAKKIATGIDSYSAVISQFLNVTSNQSTIKYKYGDQSGFCLEATTANLSAAYRISSSQGISNVQQGICPTPASNATTSCVAGKVVVVVQQTNDTTGDVIMTNTSIYGQNTSTVRTPGQGYSIATTSGLPSVPAGFTTTIVRGTNGFTYYSERYHAYEARTCA